MKKIGLLGFCVFLAACTSSSNIKPQKEVVYKSLTDAERVYISQIEKDGRLMYEKDIRAAQATDILLTKINPSDYPNFVGWVTYPTAEDYTVSFYEKNVTTFNVIADVNFKETGKASINLLPGRELSVTEKSMIKARISALESGTTSCSDRFNTIVIPSQNNEAWDVYMLAATTDPTLIKVGGHVKVTVSKNNSEVLQKQLLSNSCLALDKSGSNLPEGASVSALAVSHVVTPMPIAIHTYLNHLHDISFAVSSEKGLWMIESGSVRVIDSGR